MDRRPGRSNVAIIRQGTIISPFYFKLPIKVYCVNGKTDSLTDCLTSEYIGRNVNENQFRFSLCGAEIMNV